MNYSSHYPAKVTINQFIVSFTIALLQGLSMLWEILTSDWLDDIIQSTAPYVTIKYKEL